MRYFRRRKKELSSKRVKKRAVKLEPRPAATQEFYDLFLKERRPKGYSETNWLRSRLAITCLRLFGLRASEAGLVKVSDLESLMEGANSFSIFQPKVNDFRVPLVTPDVAPSLRRHHEEDLRRLKAAHGGNSEVCLSASCQGKTKGKPLSTRDWSSGLNIILKSVAKKHGFRSITTHCFRINYITCLLARIPIQQVQKVIGHRDITTTSLYDRFDVNNESLLWTISEALNTKGSAGGAAQGSKSQRG